VSDSVDPIPVNQTESQPVLVTDSVDRTPVTDPPADITSHHIDHYPVLQAETNDEVNGLIYSHL